MLRALKKSTGQSAFASSELKSNGPFICPECDGEVVLRKGSVRISHFKHKQAVSCDYGQGETPAHRRCKIKIYKALLKEPNVRKAALERSLKTCRPDVSAYINDVPVAIEVQISTLSMETIIRRTEEYGRKGIYVLWLLQWTPYLDSVRYNPRLWEKWIHAAYFGRVYYWIEGLNVTSYHFEPYYDHIGGSTWRSVKGSLTSSKSYKKKSKRFRSPIRGKVLNLARDFAPKVREAWEAKGFVVPAAKLFMEA